ncbi:MAG: hypothetical protein AB8B83_06025 [Bdellovibrionales bacterium]
MGIYVDMSDVEMGGGSVLGNGFNALSNPITAPELSPEDKIAIAPSDFKNLAPQGDGLDGARESAWNKLS